MQNRSTLFHVCLALAILVTGFTSNLRANTHNLEQRYVHVLQGQSLHTLIKSLFPDHKIYWSELADQFVALNPKAFKNGDADRVQEGAKLEVPKHLRIIGRLDALQGKAQAIDPFGSKRNLKPGDPIYLGDSLNTNTASQAEVIAEDEALIYVRPRSSLRFIEYKYQEKKTGRSLMQLVRGGLRTITGKIGREYRASYRLDTPFATIGIRGTDYGVRLCSKGVCEIDGADGATAAAGAYVAVAEGNIDLANSADRQSLTKGDYVYLASKTDSAKSINGVPSLVYTADEIAALGLDANANNPGETADSNNSWWLAAGAVLLLLTTGL